MCSFNCEASEGCRHNGGDDVRESAKRSTFLFVFRNEAQGDIGNLLQQIEAKEAPAADIRLTESRQLF